MTKTISALRRLECRDRRPKRQARPPWKTPARHPVDRGRRPTPDHSGRSRRTDDAKRSGTAVGHAGRQGAPYLVSFGKLGLVEQDAATSRYELGPLALQLGLTCLRRLNPVRLGTHAATDLAEQLHQTVALAVWGNAGPTIVHIEESSHPIHINMRTGTVMSLFKTATGRVFAAYLPENDRALYRNRLAPPRLSQERSAPVMEGDPEAAQGNPCARYGAGRQRTAARYQRLSAPVFDHEGHLALVITVLGPTALFDPSLDGENAGHCVPAVPSCRTVSAIRPNRQCRSLPKRWPH